MKKEAYNKMNALNQLSNDQTSGKLETFSPVSKKRAKALMSRRERLHKIIQAPRLLISHKPKLVQQDS